MLCSWQLQLIDPDLISPTSFQIYSRANRTLLLLLWFMLQPSSSHLLSIIIITLLRLAPPTYPFSLPYSYWATLKYNINRAHWIQATCTLTPHLEVLSSRHTSSPPLPPPYSEHCRWALSKPVCMDENMDGWREGWMNGCVCVCVCVCVC